MLSQLEWKHDVRERRRQWYARLLQPRIFCCCKALAEAEHQCVYWDEKYHTASDDELDRRRRADLDNFSSWLNEFCSKMGERIEDSLLLYDRRSVCVCCLLRGIYELLRVELLAPKMYEATEQRDRACHADHILDLNNAKTPEALHLQNELLAAAWALFVRPLQNEGKKVHWNHMAELMDHGRSFEFACKNGTLGRPQFWKIGSGFEPSTLRKRAAAGDPANALGSLLFRIPLCIYLPIDFFPRFLYSLFSIR